VEPDVRARLGLPAPVRQPGPGRGVRAWPMQHPELAVFCWSAAMLAVFAPLAVHLYRRKALGSAGQRWPAAATMATSAQAIEMVPENVIGLPFTITDSWLRAFSPRPIT
jgi:hypothetical protein